MKIFYRLYGSAALVAGMALLSSSPLRAQQLAPSTPAPSSPPAAQPPGAAAPTAQPAAGQPAASAGPILVIPKEWKVTVQNTDTPYTPGAGVTTPNNDPKAVTLLYSAWNGVETYASIVRVVVTHFKAYGPTLANGGAMGIESESAQFLQGIIAQGYVPSAEATSNGTTQDNKFTITIEVTAKNAVADERIFTYTAVVGGNASARYALYTSRPANNAGSNAEMESIIKSFNPPDGPTAKPVVVAGGVPGAAEPPGAAEAPGAAQPPGAAQAPGSNSVSAIDPNAPVSAQAAQIVKDYHSALVMVEGNKGVGSGFLCKMDDGKFYVITNAHVLADNYGVVKFTSVDGTAYAAGVSAVAVDHDIVKLQIASAPKAFEMMTSLDSAAKIGDAVMIPGNAEGAQVVHPVEGKIVGLGPNLIEVDAPFVKGNSGSPIIHEASGKVIGVATYLMQRKVRAEGDNSAPGNNGPPGSGGGAPGGGSRVVIETRRFGFRIDSVKQWQAIDWRIFYAEAQQVSAIEDLSGDFITMFNDIEKGDLEPENYKSTTMSRAVRNFLQAKNQLGANASAQDRESVFRGFFADLRAATRGDIVAFDARPAYDYFRKDVDEEARFRDELYDEFTKVMEAAGTIVRQNSNRPPGARPPGSF